MPGVVAGVVPGVVHSRSAQWLTLVHNGEQNPSGWFRHSYCRHVRSIADDDHPGTGHGSRKPSAGAAGLRARVLAEVSDRLPLGVRTARLAPTGRAAAALAAVGLLAAGLAAVLLLWARPHEVRAPVLVASAAATTSPGAAAGSDAGSTPFPAAAGSGSTAAASGPGPVGSPPLSATALVVVDVVGPVRRPGVVRLPPGARIVDALAAAGGLKPGASAGMLNLAAVVSDGQQIVVGGPRPPAALATPTGPAGIPGATGPAASSAAVDLNTATREQLDELPGVGPVLAQRILDWRAANGRFTSTDQLAEVGGIGERKLADLRPRVRV